MKTSMTGTNLNRGPRPIGILAALPEEIAGLIDRMEGPSEASTGAHVTQWGRRDFHRGRLHGQDCVVALSRIGKVAAAATASTLIHRFDVSAIVFVGVAGGVAHQVHVGDVVVADVLLQHDINAEPLFPRYEVPLLARARFDADSILSNALADATAAFLTAIGGRNAGAAVEGLGDCAGPGNGAGGDRIAAGPGGRDGADDAVAAPAPSHQRPPRLHRGLIGSGDRFVCDRAELHALVAALPDLLAVDMESAAVAQVCYEHDVPVAILRSISDGADESAAMSFSQFLTTVAGHYADGILERFLTALPAIPQ